MNKKAFTLTELLAVIIIIALVSLFAIPAVQRLKEDNTEKESEYYYNAIKEASLVYAKSKSDMLGGKNDEGCLEVELQTLIDEGYLKKYDKEEIVYSEIVIKNKKGHITSNVYLEFEDYDYGSENFGACNAYNPSIKNTLREELINYNDTVKRTKSGFIIGTDSSNSNPNNYVWYSGKLWRAFYIDSKTKQVKLISDEIIGIVPFNKTDNKIFKNSYIEKWLNEYFLNTLYNSNKYISNHLWEYQTNTKERYKIGLISKEEYETSGLEYLRTNQKYWSLTAGSTNPYMINNNSISMTDSKKEYGVRPVIYLNANILKVAGNGAKETPYELEGNQITDVRISRLSSRNSGEYVKLGGTSGKLFRIVSASYNSPTKLISMAPVKEGSKTTFAMGSNQFALSKLYEVIESDIDNNNLNKYITSGEWCLSSKEEETGLTNCVNNKTQTFKPGIPRYGELFASSTNYSGGTVDYFWTLTPKSSDINQNLIMTFNSDGTSSEKSSTELLKIRYMIYADKNLTIASGRGTYNKPFIIE